MNKLTDPSNLASIEGEAFYYIENLQTEDLFKFAFFMRFRNQIAGKLLPSEDKEKTASVVESSHGSIMMSDTEHQLPPSIRIQDNQLSVTFKQESAIELPDSPSSNLD